MPSYASTKPVILCSCKANVAGLLSNDMNCPFLASLSVVNKDAPSAFEQYICIGFEFA